MTEHVHEWYYNNENGMYSCKHCKAAMGKVFVEARLNEYETQKKATERRYAHKHVIQVKDGIITLETSSDEGMNRWKELFESVLAELEEKDARTKQIR
jgi:peptide methionine sulfoxide reductase MsrB